MTFLQVVPGWVKTKWSNVHVNGRKMVTRTNRRKKLWANGRYNACSHAKFHIVGVHTWTQMHGVAAIDKTINNYNAMVIWYLWLLYVKLFGSNISVNFRDPLTRRIPHLGMKWGHILCHRNMEPSVTRRLLGKPTCYTLTSYKGLSILVYLFVIHFL